MSNWKLVYKGEILGDVEEWGDRMIPTEGKPVVVRYVRFIRLSDEKLQEWEVGGWLVDFVHHHLIVGPTQSNSNIVDSEKVIGDRVRSD